MMSQFSFMTDEQWSLIDASCNGNITPEEIKILDELLKNSSEVRQFYSEYCQFHTELYLARGEEVAFSGVVEGLDASEAFAADSCLSEKPTEITPSSLSFVSNVTHQVGVIISKPTPLSIAMAFVVIVSILTTLALITTSNNSGPIADNSDSGDYKRAKIVATVTHLQDCHWKNSDTGPTVGHSLRETNKLELAKGLLQITFDTGASVIVNGPASIKILSSNEAELTHGKLLANVPQAAKGFVIVTPSVRVVDLGTEFGVEVNEDGSANVHVFKGEVEAVVSDKQGQVIRKVPLLADQAAFFDISREPNQMIAADVNLFRQSREFQESLLNPPYARAVKAAKPVVYWRFEEIENGLIKNEMADRFHAKVVGSVKLSQGIKNKTAIFRGKPTDDRYLLSNEYLPKLISGDYSIELWVKADRLHEGSLVGFLAKDKSIRPGRLMLSYRVYTKSDDQLYFYARNEKRESVKIISQKRHETNQWHHIVVTKNGNTSSLFLDGKRVGQTKNTLKFASDVQIIVGKRRPVITAESKHYLEGELDELAIYKRAISSREIKKHFQLGQWLLR